MSSLVQTGWFARSRRAPTGIRSTDACSSAARSATATGSATCSSEPPRLRAPATMAPPRVRRSGNAPVMASGAAEPRSAPEAIRVERAQLNRGGNGRRELASGWSPCAPARRLRRPSAAGRRAGGPGQPARWRGRHTPPNRSRSAPGAPGPRRAEQATDPSVSPWGRAGEWPQGTSGRSATRSVRGGSRRGGSFRNARETRTRAQFRAFFARKCSGRYRNNAQSAPENAHSQAFQGNRTAATGSATLQPYGVDFSLQPSVAGFSQHTYVAARPCPSIRTAPSATSC